MSDVDTQQIFMCDVHRFVVVVRGGEMSCRGTPGHRGAGCESCDATVDRALSACGWAVDRREVAS